LEKTTVQKETKSLQRRISSLTLFGKMFFFSMFVSLSKIKLGKTLQMKNGSSSLSSSSSSFQ
jgi:cell division protein FtsL